MMGKLHFHMPRKSRLIAVIAISFTFFVAEISTGFYTRSLALVADAFHYLNDLIGFVIALVAVHVSEGKKSRPDLSFGFARAQLLGAFFNGTFLVGLGLSIALQSIERFISIQRVNNPKLVLIIGSVGLFLNILSATFLHEHDHGHGHSHGHDHGDDTASSHSHVHESSTHAEDIEAALTGFRANHADHMHLAAQIKPHGMDLGILGVLVHLLGDAINNIGVIVSALIIWFVKSKARFYADPAVSMFIAIMVLVSGFFVVKRSGIYLLESAPPGVNLDHIKKDLESIPGVQSIHELHVWRLDQKRCVASAHVVVTEESLPTFLEKAQILSQCLHAYGIHSATLQPELRSDDGVSSGRKSGEADIVAKCGITCGSLCKPLMCCEKNESV